VAEQLKAVAGQFDFLSKTMLEAAGLDVTAPTGSVSFSLPDADGYIPVGDSINRDEVKKNKEKEAEKLRGFISGSEKKLANEGFMAKAPIEVVQEIRERLTQTSADIESITAQLAALPNK
jgi:valyl-tRNA synthetase